MMNGVIFLIAFVASMHALVIPEPKNNCEIFKSCVSCTNTTSFSERTECRWCANRCLSIEKSTALCGSRSSPVEIGDTKITRFDDTCSVSRPPISPRLASWMSDSLPAINHLTLLDLSLPGTHDTLTDDLSTIVSDGGADDMYTFAELMHKFEKVVPDDIEDFIRQQAQTQDLNIVEQLNNGIRFLDLRIMFEYTDASPDWYSLHFMQTNSPAMKYFTDILNWMVSHPNEIVVMWLSKHGNTGSVGEDQYPKTPIAQKQAYWSSLMTLFDGLMVDFRVTKINETSISDMLARNHRAVFYVSDYAEFTGSSPFALNGALIDNNCGPSVDAEISALAWERSLFSTSSEIIKRDKVTQRLFLMSMATGVPSESTVMEGTLRFLPNKHDNQTAMEIAKCAATFHIPGLNWCPPTLLDISQLENYYKQISLDEAVSKSAEGWRLPNAIYLNGLDWYGTIRTGTRVLWGADRNHNDVNNTHATTAFAYVDLFILTNLQVGCASAPSTSQATCAKLKDQAQTRREAYPQTFWNDPTFGRLVNWPSSI